MTNVTTTSLQSQALRYAKNTVFGTWRVRHVTFLLIIFLSNTLDIFQWFNNGRPIYVAGVNEAGWRAFLLLGFGFLSVGPSRVMRAALTQMGYLLFLLFMAFGLSRSPTFFTGIKTWLYLFYPFGLYALVLASRLQERDIRWLVGGLFLSGILYQVAVFALWSIGRHPLFLADNYSRLHSNPFYFGLLVILGASMWCFRALPKRYIWMLLTLVFAGLLVWTSVRITLAGLVIALICMMIVHGHLKLALFVIGLSLLSLNLLPEWLTRLQGLDLLNWLLYSRDLQQLKFGSFGDRFGIWTYALDRLFLPNPLFGSGLGSISLIFQEGLSLEVTGGLVHGEFVRLLSESGLIGAGLFLISFWGLLRSLWRAHARAQSRLSIALSLAAFGGVAFYIVTCLTDNSIFYYYSFGGYVWVLAALEFQTQRLDKRMFLKKGK